MQNKMKRCTSALLWIFITTAVLSLPACGQTGDLYLPDADEQEEDQREVIEDGSF
jgi:predicted small lipoprotein YifL